MRSKPPTLLVLDGQGVVFDAPFTDFLRWFARENGLHFEAVLGRWQSGLRQLAWSGVIEDKALWNELAGRRVNLSQTMAALQSSYRPGPAAAYLSSWSRLVPIWLLSNHRTHWVRPMLNAMDVLGAFQRLLISDTTGIVKPDPAAFRQLAGEVAAGEVLFVDDQLHNCRAAASMGLHTVHASSDGRWVSEVDSLLRGAGRARRFENG